MWATTMFDKHEDALDRMERGVCVDAGLPAVTTVGGLHATFSRIVALLVRLAKPPPTSYIGGDTR